MLARVHQRDRHADTPRAADAADAVHVGLGRCRHVVVHDVRERPDVQPSRGHVGRHDQVGRAAPQPRHDPLALLLVHAAVQRLGAVAAAAEGLGELVDLHPPAAEDEGGLRALHVQDPPQRRGLVGGLDDVRDLPHQRGLA